MRWFKRKPKTSLLRCAWCAITLENGRYSFVEESVLCTSCYTLWQLDNPNSQPIRITIRTTAMWMPVEGEERGAPYATAQAHTETVEHDPLRRLTRTIHSS